METLSHHILQGKSNALLIPDLTAALPLLSVTGGLVVTSMMLDLPKAQAALQRGDACEAVARLQDALLEAGFDPGSIDGAFGGQTEYAVMRFQEKNKLISDRVVGQVTATALGLDPAISCESATPADDGAVVTIPVRFGHVITEGAALNVRSGPGETYSVQNTVENGVVVRIVGQPVDSWLQLVEGGWIHSQWVKFVNLAPVEASSPATSAPVIPSIPASTPNTPKAIEKDTDTDNAKQEPATDGTEVKKSSTTTTTAANAEKPAETSTTPGAVGAKVSSPATPATIAPTFQRVKINTGGNPLNVRKGAGLDYDVLQQLDDLWVLHG